MLVLLVDDVQNIRKTHKGMLETLGHRVIEATDGKGAIQTAAVSTPDTILLDLSMPDMDGLLTVAALRTISPLRSVPIVATSAFPTYLVRDRALAAGCNAYLENPFTIDSLADVLNKL